MLIHINTAPKHYTSLPLVHSQFSDESWKISVGVLCLAKSMFLLSFDLVFRLTVVQYFGHSCASGNFSIVSL